MSNAGHGGGVVIPISVQIKNWREQLAELQSSIKPIKVDTKIGKEAQHEIEQLARMIENVSKTMNIRVTTDSGITKFEDRAQEINRLFQQAGATIQKVTLDDLVPEYVAGRVKDIVADIEKVKTAMSEDVGKQFSDMLKNLDPKSALGKFFDKNNIQDFKDLTLEQTFEHITAAIEASTNAAESFREKIADNKTIISEQSKEVSKFEEIQAAMSKMDFGAVLNQVRTQFSNLNVKIPFTENIQTMVEKIRANLGEAQNITAEAREKILADLQALGDAKTSEGVFDAFETLKADLKDANLLQRFKQEGAILNFKDLIRIDPASLQQAQDFLREQLSQVMPKEKVDEIVAAFTQTFSEKTNNSLNDATKNSEAAFNNYQAVLAKAIVEIRAKIAELNQENKELNNKASGATWSNGSNERALDQVNAMVEQIVAPYKARIIELEQQLKATQEEAVKGVQGGGANVHDKAVENYNQMTAAANQYRAQLDQVHNSEQMIGKIQGVVQRWFSIYAAVRMVGNAVRDVIKTITELDKTITKISVVTSMSSGDLWNQMPEYVQMAQQYGASIAGVYEVSQLYYQQGLQTNDVMNLTSETLKMAQISGLNYATATDYMTNALRSFKMEMEDASRVTDVYAVLAASSASSVEELATAMSKTASSAEAVGATFEQTSTMMAVMIEATREAPENIGSAMKSIISRYGELKEDPTKLIDSEGEELSLNKVDKALQSVGITLQDAQGQFRNFGDVIQELSSIWNTLDSNTQRYIATVMAGNRQQSRFLALVSSGERYDELLEKANSADEAGTLQQLKVMDSVETKAQQVQNALQSIYTSAGIEDLLKGWYDFEKRVISTYATISQGSTGLVGAIGTIAGQFTQVATLVTTLFNYLKSHAAFTQSTMTNDAVKGATERLNAEMSFGARLRQLWQDLVQGHKAYTAEMVADTKNATEEQLQAQAQAANQAAQRRGNLAKAGMVASAAGLALQSWSLNMGTSTEGERIGKGVTQGAGSILSGIGTMAMMGGGLPGAIIGVLSALPGIISAIDVMIETTSEKITRLKGEVTETQNAFKKSKATADTLANELKLWEELSSKRFDSVEAMQAYIDKSNEIADSFPDLVSAYDAEGNAVIEAAQAYEYLAKVRGEASENGTTASSKALELADTQIKNAKETRTKAVQEASDQLFGSMYNGSGTYAAGRDTNSLYQLLTIAKDNLDADGLALLNLLTQSLNNNKNIQVEGYGNDQLRTLLQNFRANIDKIHSINDQSFTAFGTEFYAEDVLQTNGTLSLGSLAELILEDDTNSTADWIVEIAQAYQKKDYQLLYQLQQTHSEELQNYISTLNKNQDSGEWSIVDRFISSLPTLANYDGAVSRAEKEYELILKREASSLVTNEVALDEAVQKINGNSDINAQKRIQLLKSKNNADLLLSNYFADEFTKWEDSAGNKGKTWEDWVKTGEYRTLYDSFTSEILKNDNEELRGLITNYSKYTVDQAKQVLSSLNITSGALYDQIISIITKQQESSTWDEFVQHETQDSTIQLLSQELSARSEEINNLSTVEQENFKQFYLALKNRVKNENMSVSNAAEVLSLYWQALATSVKDGKIDEIAQEKILSVDINDTKSIDNFKQWAIEYYNGENNIPSAIQNFIKELEGLPQSLGLITEPVLSALVNSNKNLEKNLSKLRSGLNPQELNDVINTFNVGLENFTIGVDGLFRYTGDLSKIWQAYSQGALEAKKLADTRIQRIREVQSSNESLNQYAALFTDVIEQDLDLYDEVYQQYIDEGYAHEVAEFEANKKSQIEHKEIWKKTGANGETIYSPLITQLAETIGILESSVYSYLEQYTASLGGEQGDIIGFFNYITSQSDMSDDMIKASAIRLIDTMSSGEEALIRKWLVNNGENIDEAFNEITAEERTTAVEALKDTAEWQEIVIKARQDLASTLKNGITSDAESIVIQIKDEATREAMQHAGLDVKDTDTSFKASIEDMRNALNTLYDDLTLETANEYKAAIAEADNKPFTDAKSALKNYANLSESDMAKLATGIGLTLERFKEVYNIDTTGGISSMSLSNVDAYAQELAKKSGQAKQEIIKDLYNSIIQDLTQLPGNQSKGFTDITAMQKYYDKLVANGQTTMAMIGDENAMFQWNDTLQAYQFTTQGLIAQMRDFYSNFNNLSEDQRNISEQLFQSNIDGLRKNIDVQGFATGTISIEQFKKSIKDVNDVIEARNTSSWGAIYKQRLTELQMAEPNNGELDYDALVADATEYANNSFEQLETLDEKELIDQIREGGDAAVEAAKKVYEGTDKKLSGEELEAIYKSRFTQLSQSLNDLESMTLGTHVEGVTKELLGLAGYKFDDNGLISTVGNMLQAYQMIYETMKTSAGRTQSELNQAYAKIWEYQNRDENSLLEALSAGVSMSADQLANLFGESLNLEEALTHMDQYGLQRLMGGKIRIENLDKFLQKTGWENLDRGSNEYLDALSAYNQSWIEYETKRKTALENEIKSLEDIDYGDYVDVSWLRSALGDNWNNLKAALGDSVTEVSDGLLKIDDAADIPRILELIARAAQEGGGELSEQMAQLSVALTNVLKNFADLIGEGIEGTLDDVQAQKLDQFARSTLKMANGIDVYRTADGLKLTNDSALQLYSNMQKINHLASRIVFNKLSESILSTNPLLEDQSALLGRIRELNDEINSGKYSGERLATLQAERDVLQQMADIRGLDNPESFNFMNNSLPSYLQSGVNYVDSFSKMLDAMKQGATDGYMAPQDFYNMVTEFGNMAAAAGEELVIAGVKFDKDGEMVSKLIADGFSNIKSVEGKGAQIDLSGIGLNLVAEGSNLDAGMQAGIKAIAAAQISAIDAAIAVLEVVVAMEQIGDIDVDDDMKISLPEIFIDSSDDNDITEADATIDGYLQLTEKAKELFDNWATLIDPKSASYSEAFDKAAHAISDGNMTVAQMIEKGHNNSFTVDDLKSMPMLTFLNYLAHADFDLSKLGESTWQNIQNAIAATEDLNQIIYKIDENHEVIITDSGHFTVDWTTEEMQSLIADIQKKQHGSVEDAKKAIEQAMINTNRGEYTIDDLETTFRANGTIKVVDGQETITFNGKTYTNDAKGQKQFKAAVLAKQKSTELGFKESQMQIAESGTSIQATQSFKSLQNENIEYTVSANIDVDGETTWKFNGDTIDGQYKDVSDAIRGYLESRRGEGDTRTLREIAVEQGIQINANLNPASFTTLDEKIRTELIGKLKDSDYKGAIDILTTASFDTSGLNTLQDILTATGLKFETQEIVVNATAGTVDQAIADLLNATEAIDRTINVNVTPANAEAKRLLGDDAITVKAAGQSGNNGRPGADTIVHGMVNASRAGAVATNDSSKGALTAIQSLAASIATNLNRTHEVTYTAPQPQTQTQTITPTAQIAPEVEAKVILTNENFEIPTIEVPADKFSLPDISLDSFTASYQSAVSAASSAIENIAAGFSTAAMAASTAANKAASAATSAINSIPGRKAVSFSVSGTVTAFANVSLNISTNSTSAAVGSVSKTYYPYGNQITSSNVRAAAKGNVALAGGRTTLMGELGPELVVSKGRYFVVGQGGAEFVDLDPDAIVFNHLQTASLLSGGRAGRGIPVTNERKATSLAKGNIAGPAKASAAAALAELKKIRAMWASLGDSGLSELAEKAGSGGGGGGGGKNAPDLTAFLDDIERWYTLLRRIKRLEEDISYQETLRSKIESDRIIDGTAYYNSQKKSLDLLDEEIQKKHELANLQKSYYEARSADLAASDFGGILHFDPNGGLVLNDKISGDGWAPTRFNIGSAKSQMRASVADELPEFVDGLQLMEEVFARNADDSAKYTSKEQYAILQAAGFERYMNFDSSGKAIERSDDTNWEADAVKAFKEKVDGWQEELDSLWESFRQTEEDLLSAETEHNELLQEIVDNQLSLEKRVVKAEETRRQREIDNLQDERNAIEESTNEFIDGLNDALTNERQLYDNNQDEQELTRLRRQLSILERSGGSASDIRSLQEDIRSREQDSYFNQQEQQIQAIEQASQAQIERLDKQIDLMTEALAYDKANGLLWDKVYAVMNSTPAEIQQFIMTNTPDFQSNSALQVAEDLRVIKGEVEQWVAYRDDENDPVSKEAQHNWDTYLPSFQELYPEAMLNPEIIENARLIYEGNYARTADENAARKAVEDYLADAGYDRRGTKAIGQNQRFGNWEDYILPEKEGGGGGGGNGAGGGGGGGGGNSITPGETAKSYVTIYYLEQGTERPLKDPTHVNIAYNETINPSGYGKAANIAGYNFVQSVPAEPFPISTPETNIYLYYTAAVDENGNPVDDDFTAFTKGTVAGAAAAAPVTSTGETFTKPTAGDISAQIEEKSGKTIKDTATNNVIKDTAQPKVTNGKITITVGLMANISGEVVHIGEESKTMNVNSYIYYSEFLEKVKSSSKVQNCTYVKTVPVGVYVNSTTTAVQFTYFFNKNVVNPIAGVNPGISTTPVGQQTSQVKSTTDTAISKALKTNATLDVIEETPLDDGGVQITTRNRSDSYVVDQSVDNTQNTHYALDSTKTPKFNTTEEDKLKNVKGVVSVRIRWYAMWGLTRDPSNIHQYHETTRNYRIGETISARAFQPSTKAGYTFSSRSSDAVVTANTSVVTFKYNFTKKETSTSTTKNSSSTSKPKLTLQAPATKKTTVWVNGVQVAKQGGLFDSTGLMQIDGTADKPEAVLDADTTRIWRHDIMDTSNPKSLTNLLLDFRNVAAANYSSGAYSSINNTSNGGMNFNGVTVNVNVAEVASDYDATRIGDLAMEEMLSIARKTTASQVRR